MKIYLSEFAISPDITRNNNYDEVIELILKVCKQKGIGLFRSRDFWGYDSIENCIRHSNLLIALIDEYWTSSTWKLHELFYAAGTTGAMGTIKLPAEKIATIAYLLDDIKTPWLKSLHNTLVIQNNLEVLREYLIGPAKC